MRIIHNILFIVFSSCLLSTAQFINPYPVTDCSSGLTFGFSTCPNQPGCCAGGAACCAGGCCPLTAWCINQGTPSEGCCPLSDKNSCGASIASFSKPACTAGGALAKPSVQCVSADDDWYCPPGSVCGLRSPLCHGFSGQGCTSETGESVVAPTPRPTAGSSTTSASDDSTSEEANTVDGTATQATTPTPSGEAVARMYPSLGVIAAFGALLGML